MKSISLLDTSVCSSNLGDQIIMDSVTSILEEMFAYALYIHLPTHDVISKSSYKIIQDSDFTFVGGTNLLSSNMNVYNQWKVTLWDSLFVKDVILMGVGWWQYQKKPNAYTRILFNRLLTKKFLHSARDSYTAEQLKFIGISNVLNTACPTMWSLTPEHCDAIADTKADEVLVTFTEYHQREKLDFELTQLLKQEYAKVYFWTQQPRDYPYMRNFCQDSVEYIKPSLKALDEFLSTHNVDYVGTRLHAGIRSLKHKRRSLILAVDNRAAEISKDTGLDVIPRGEVEAIKNWINSPQKTKIKLPQENIDKWKSQFGGNGNPL